MRTHTLFPMLLVAIASLFFATAVIAQSSEGQNSPAAPSINAKASVALETPPIVGEDRGSGIVTTTPGARAAAVVPEISLPRPFAQSLLTAIQSHVGATYRFNRTGPDAFDCSGLVWRAFQDVGVNFQRGPARSYWATFAAPPKNEEFKFGTLVFFSNLRHVGIVVDEKGFYHSARHGGVMYSPFNEYWLSRIDGFRRVPIPSLPSVGVRTRSGSDRVMVQ